MDSIKYLGVVALLADKPEAGLKSGEHLILETKGQQLEKDKAKRGFLEEWVRAVNQHGGFGKWRPALSQ